ncbi:MAG: Lsr2 family protein [Pseudonocardia sp.]|nr:Lsr2 family protein [Pseudonocardia sp.]
MSRHTVISLVDDFDGTAADETLSFAVDGRHYEIELSASHAAALRSGLIPFIEHARPAVRPQNRTSAPGSRAATTTGRRAELAAVRQWARSQGIDVSDRGRISGSVWEAYEKRDLPQVHTVPSPFMS